jgi:hypothetical protein
MEAARTMLRETELEIGTVALKIGHPGRLFRRSKAWCPANTEPNRAARLCREDHPASKSFDRSIQRPIRSVIAPLEPLKAFFPRV